MATTTTWKRGLEFAVQFAEGEQMTLASVPLKDRPGPGPSPMDLVQAAVAGCTGIDVVMILEKMRKKIDALRVEIEATRREEEPRVFTHLNLVYYVDGTELTEAAVRRAVQLSQEKYCSVAAMVRPTVELSYEIVLNGHRLTT